jgi:protein-S-isoprenylcysteine O-methyltransferase Ste14
MTSKLYARTALWLTGMALLLFVPAGTVRWPGAWAFLAIGAISGIGMGAWLARTDPALLEERMAPPLQAGQPAADKLIIAILLLGFCAWFVVMGYDVGHRGSAMPTFASFAGAAGVICCMIVPI